MDSAKNNILARLKATQEKRGEIEVKTPDFTSPIYLPLNESLSLEFKTNLEIIGGQVIFCASKSYPLKATSMPAPRIFQYR